MNKTPCKTGLSFVSHDHYISVGSNKEGGQRKGQAWSSIGKKRWRRKQSRRQMDQQMVSFRCIPEDDRAAGHMQRGIETGTHRDEKGGFSHWRAFLFSCSPYLCCVKTKGQQLLQLSHRCLGKRRNDSPRITLICRIVHTKWISHEFRNVRGVACKINSVQLFAPNWKKKS